MRQSCLIMTVLVSSIAWASPLCAVQATFSADHYIQYNEVVVEGTVLEDFEAQPLAWLKDSPGWFFPTKCSSIVVESVLLCDPGVSVAAGDTIRFCYPSGNEAKIPDRPDRTIRVNEISTFDHLEVGLNGIFPFRKSERFGLVPGSWFLTSESQREEIRGILRTSAEN